MYPDDYLDVLKRRKWSMIVPAIIIMVAAAAIALLLPPVYKSTATILIEEQEIPDDFVKAAVTSYAEERIQTINQWLMSSTRIIDIIKRFDLYADLRDSRTTEELVEKMRNNTELQIINAEVVDPRSGRPSEAIIAFNISFMDSGPPEKVQQVITELAALFLERNLNVRTQQTLETSRFLESEMGKVKNALDTLEAKIAVFKRKNINTLPELLPVNTQTLNNIEQTIEALETQLRSTKEREGYFQAQLANISPYQELQQTDNQRLDQLKMELVELQSRFTSAYPDVVKTKAEIADLESQMATNRQNYISETVPDNPAYITLASQLSSTKAEIISLREQIANMKAKAERYRNQIENTPRVEETYRAMLVERNNTQAKYDDLMRKVMEARVSQGLEKEQKGERFTLLDPARLPEKPFKPNRKAIGLIGIILGIGAGVGFASLREFTDMSIRSVERLTQLTGYPVIAVIPVITTPKGLSRRRMMTLTMTVGTLIVVAAGLLLFFLQITNPGASL